MRFFGSGFGTILLMMLMGSAVMAQDFDHAGNGEPIFDVLRANALPRAERLAYQQTYKSAWENWAQMKRNKSKSENTKFKVRGKVFPIFGTIQYDNGVATGLATNPTSFTHGNHFTTADGIPVLFSGSVSAIEFYMAYVGGTGAFVSIFGPVNGTTAKFLTSVLATGLVSGTFNQFVFPAPVAYSGDNFIAGVWLNPLPPPEADALGFGSGTTRDQGFHGAVINDIVGTAFATVPGVNYLIRPSGIIICPVELIHFEVE